MIFLPWQRPALPPHLDYSAADRLELLNGIPVCSGLGMADKERLLDLADEFLARKNMEGVQGMVLTPRIQWMIALQACLPILHLGLKVLNDLKSVVVYQGDFIPPWQKTDEIGVVHPVGPHQGESWQLGTVVLSWDAVEEDMKGEGEYPTNVIIHEIAHQLDKGGGGMPELPWTMSRASWMRDFSMAFITMEKRHKKGKTTPLDPYALESAAEFFAVACEAFFVAPGYLQEVLPAVYGQLVGYFRWEPN
ncbi:MAG: zinc-dependent peptidase [Magnetococcales bacterium]|nr:zinc-dependent peptidase [Magnetococcales bacterium]NGZ26165.1 zinc-dependent peptidase [Magnetococcales bacterium]